MGESHQYWVFFFIFREKTVQFRLNEHVNIHYAFYKYENVLFNNSV